MTSTFPIYWPRYLMLCISACLVALLILFIVHRRPLQAECAPEIETSRHIGSDPNDWANGVAFTSMAWSVLVAHEGGGLGSGPVTNKLTYRLAGTFFNEDDRGRQTRQAVLDDLRKRDQRIVSEGEEWDDVRVESIYTDHVVLIRGGIREEIWLSLMTASTDPTPAESDSAVTNSASTEMAIATNRFGAQISSYRWVIKRDALMDYAQSVAEDSVRVAQLFDSLKPIYDDRKRIHGYELETQGESDFFRDVGLKEGDQVQKVNGMPMSNRRRAEFFISEFTNNRMNVFVLDIDRDGQKQKLIYQLQ